MEQVIEQNLALDEVAVFVLFDTESGDKCQDNRFPGLRSGYEYVDFVLQSRRIILVDFKYVIHVFYLAQIDCVVLSVDQKIYLGAFLSGRASP